MAFNVTENVTTIANCCNAPPYGICANVTSDATLIEEDATCKTKASKTKASKSSRKSKSNSKAR